MLTARGPLRWISWLVGLAVVAAVIGGALHFSEERELVRLAEGARPGWLLVAALLQAGTYLACHGVLVTRLSAIENLGSMDVLCTDKTGTLTEGVVRLEGAYDASGARSAAVLELGAQNAALQTGLANPLDDAILEVHPAALERVEKLAEVPYDFVRKRLSVVVRGAGGVRLVTKGAFEQVLLACDRAGDGAPLDAARRAALEERFRAWSSQGTRVLAVAARALPEQPSYGRDDERELEPLPAGVVAALVLISLLHVLAAELAKAGFYRKVP